MDKPSVVLLLCVMICSSALGVAATGINYKLLPSTTISVKSQTEVNETKPLLQTLNVTNLMTLGIDKEPYAHLVAHVDGFKQGDLMGIEVYVSFIWNEVASQGTYQNATIDQNGGYIYIDDTLASRYFETIEIYNSTGTLVGDSNSIQNIGGASTVSGRYSYQVDRYAIQIPLAWAPGNYTIRFHIEELLANLQDTRETTVEICEGQPLAAKYPSPVSAGPQDFVVRIEDMPTDWIYRSEENVSTLLTDCISIYDEVFDKMSDNLTVGTTIIMIRQYENPSAANGTFEKELQDRITSETLGDPRKVTIENIGDKGYLLDNAERRTTAWNGWNYSTSATGSAVIFLKQNLIITISATYSFEAINCGLYVTNEELLQIAQIQLEKIPQ